MNNKLISEPFKIDKLIDGLEKCKQTILNMYSLIKVLPFIKEPKNITEFIEFINKLLEDFYKLIPKKSVPMQVFKQIEQMHQQKANKIASLLESQKNLKIQVKVLQEKMSEIQKQNQQKEKNSKSSLKFIETIKNIMNKQEKTKQQKNNSRQLNQQKLHKKRLSLPHLNSQKSIKKKKTSFINYPGQGNQILIQHLMNRKIIK